MSILTVGEASAVLRVESDHADMLALLPAIDAYIFGATGHNFASDEVILPLAKAAARILLVLWFENPSMQGVAGSMPISQGLSGILTQLEAISRRYVVFYGLDGAGGVEVAGVDVGDVVESVVELVGGADVSASFEEVISVDGALQQVSTSDLSGTQYRAYVVERELV